jgi:KDO2-lipid IV(A) lauroyltransferase
MSPPADAEVPQQALKRRPNAFTMLFASALTWLLERTSHGFRRALARAVGALIYGLGIRRRLVLDNLRQAFPEKGEDERRRIAQAVYRNLAQTLLDTLANEAAHCPLTFENDQALRAALKEGRGAVLATAHFGNWEVSGAAMIRSGIPFHGVVRPLSGALNAKLIESRARNGVKFIFPKGAIARMSEVVRGGGVVHTVIDQAISPEAGIWVPFFGRPACTTPAVSIVAQRTQAPVFVLMSLPQGEGHRVILEGPIRLPDTGDPKADLAAHVAALTAALERFVRRYPEQWLWLHNRWKHANTPHPAPTADRQGEQSGGKVRPA